MNKKISIAYVFLAVLLCLIASSIYTNYKVQQPVVKNEIGLNLYDKVIEKKKIEIGYSNGEPYFIKDPNTGEVSGIFADVLNIVGDKLNLSINWKAEANFATMAEDLESGKFDMIGSGIWINAERGKAADFTIPILYDVVGAYSRYNDNRFDNNLDKINSPTIKIATIDGEMAATIASQDFPKADATTASLPESADFTQMLLNLTNKKADVTFLGLGPANEFISKNPKSIKPISDKPVRLFPTAIMIKRNEYEFTRMINLALLDLMNSGEIDRIIKKYETYPLNHYRITKPYRTTID